MDDLEIFLIVTLLFLWLFRRWCDRRFIWLCTKFPCNWWHILTGFGYIISSSGSVTTSYNALNKYGKNFLCYYGPFPMFVTRDPDTIKDVLKSRQCIQKPNVFYGRLTEAFGRGFITLNDPHWTNERRIVNKAFTKRNLDSFMPIFNEEATAVLKSIDKYIEEKSSQPLIAFFRELTLSIATRTTIGRNIDETRYNRTNFAKSFSLFTRYSAEIMLNNIYLLGIMRKIARLTYFKEAVRIKTDMQQLIAESLQGLSLKGGIDPSYQSDIETAIQYMAKGVDQNKMQEQDLTNDIVHIFIGSFETSSTSIYLILLMLAIHPEYQERAYAEVCSHYPDIDEDDEQHIEVTHEHISQMVFVDMVMNETMRLIPIIPCIAREVTGDDLTLNSGKVLPKGQCIVVDIYSLHRSKEIWGPDADKFNPDNFLPANIDYKHPYSFIPFTKGVRVCMGWRYALLSVKVALIKLIKRYKFTAHCKLEDLHIENHITSHLRGEPPLYVERRNKPKRNEASVP